MRVQAYLNKNYQGHGKVTNFGKDLGYTSNICQRVKGLIDRCYWIALVNGHIMTVSPKELETLEKFQINLKKS
jgi:hypothetical protein